MGNKNVQKKPGTWKWVLLIYFACVIVRSVMAFLTTAFPTVGIDEFLYSSLGRSIATEGSLLYRGQPAKYSYLIYPLMISPVYALFGEGVNYYRVIQIWNAVIMNLAIFPIFWLCRETLKEEKKALWVSAVCMLLPDFLMSEFVFSEALIYPLFFLLVYLVYRMIQQPSLKLGTWIGVLGMLLYYTKPGAIALSAVALLFFLVRGIVRKSKKEILSAAAGFGSMGLSFLLLWLLVRFGFGYEGNLLGVYHEQLSAQDVGRNFFLETVGLYPYYFILACGILPMMAAILFFPKWSRENRQFFLLMMGSAMVVMIGTAWAVNRSEYTRYLFMRYSDMYLPLVLIACLFPEREDLPADPERKRSAKALILSLILIVYTVVCTIAWGSTVGAGSALDNHFMMSLASMMLKNIEEKTGIALDFEKDVLPLSEYSNGGSVTERHLLFAKEKKVIPNGSEEEQYKLLGKYKAGLIHEVYIEPTDELMSLDEAIAFAKDVDAILCYPYLGDVTESPTGDKKAAKFEDEYLDELMAYLPEKGIAAVTYMPSRNTETQLERLMGLCEKHGLQQISGEDINSPSQSFICKQLANPKYAHLVKAAWKLVEREKEG